MSFRQFPATDHNGDSRIILEFTPEPAAPRQGNDAPARYELDDGRTLVRSGREFTTEGGELRLTV